MATEQKVEQLWDTPSADEIPAISAQHAAFLESTDEESAWIIAGMHHVIVYTVGRRSGAPHKVVLPFWRDPDGCRVVVASFAGAERHPAWFLNLGDRDANPEVRCRIQGGEYWSVPQVLEGQERDRIWSLLLEDRAWYADYQARTERIIPLVRLPESRPA
jgi:deazaflavin-dependent oxidoreductase (nitroreductase family)